MEVALLALEVALFLKACARSEWVRFAAANPTNTAHQAHPPRSPLRLLFSSIHCYLDPASGAALCTRELLAAREMHCRVLTTEILDPESDTALDEVLAAMELPDRRFQAEL